MSEQTSSELPTRLHMFAERVHMTLDGGQQKRIPWYSDEESLDEHGERRRVVWVSRGGSTRTAKQAGGRLTGDGARAVACRIREERVEVHLFAESKAKCEQLLDVMIAAICLTELVIEIGNYEWRTQESLQNGRTLRSQYCVLLVTLALPVLEEIADLGTFDGVLEDCGILQADGSIKLADGSTRQMDGTDE